MADCDQIARLLSDYLDQNLPPDTCVSIAAHLDECSACGAEMERLRQTVDLCRRYRYQTLPSPLGEEKRAELREVLEKALADIKRERP